MARRIKRYLIYDGMLWTRRHGAQLQSVFPAIYRLVRDMSDGLSALSAPSRASRLPTRMTIWPRVGRQLRGDGVRNGDAERDAVYSERNQLVAALSKVFPSYLARHPDDGEWDEDWRWIVFVKLPTGQASWHIHDSELERFAHLKEAEATFWDGHSTEEKYRRLEALPARVTVGSTVRQDIHWCKCGQPWVRSVDGHTETACQACQSRRELAVLGRLRDAVYEWAKDLDMLDPNAPRGHQFANGLERRILLALDEAIGR